ncbi:hypothetical protein N7527_002476 [Penicillium freii]|uniref:Uncharacterized protein n=1 Tax=Penicillium freii TaxID=48697 RepID=A0A124GTF8_PENFR|nr:hypothetical protein N7527_002476 [Penicillium freii]KUM66695.1 hypothetical protein ACN42_g387 [Penicillium freii]
MMLLKTNLFITHYSTYDEADKQKLLLPYKKQKGQVGLNNKHFISDKKREGPLHYNELMVRLKGEWLDPKDPNFPSLTEPRSADDLERSAQELYDQKFKGLIDIESANPALQSKKAQDSDKAYQKLFTLLNNQLVEWHTKHSIDFLSAAESKEGVEGRFYSRNQRMTEIGKRVVKLRIADGQDYLVRMMSGDKKGELGLSEKVKTDSGEEKWQSTVRTVDAKTDVPGVPGYKSVDFVATYNDPKNNAKLKDKFPTVEDFSNWV